MTQSIPNVDEMMKKVNQLIDADCDKELFERQMLECKTLEEANHYRDFGMMAYVLYYGLKLEEMGADIERLHPFTTTNWLQRQFPADPGAKPKEAIPLESIPDPALRPKRQPSGMTYEEAVDSVEGFTNNHEWAIEVVDNTLRATSNHWAALMVATDCYTKMGMKKDIICGREFCGLLAKIGTWPKGRKADLLSKAFFNRLKYN